MELNKTYTKEIKNFSFGELPMGELIDLFKDGRTTSRFMEKILTKWFPEFVNVDQIHYDHVNARGDKFEMKGFTKASGCKFVPSSMLGKGRHIDLKELAEGIEHHKLSYIITDIVEFPKIRIKFVDGKELLNKYPNGSISLTRREEFFGT